MNAADSAGACTNSQDGSECPHERDADEDDDVEAKVENKEASDEYGLVSNHKQHATSSTRQIKLFGDKDDDDDTEPCVNPEEDDTRISMRVVPP